MLSALETVDHHSSASIPLFKRQQIGPGSVPAEALAAGLRTRALAQALKHSRFYAVTSQGGCTTDAIERLLLSVACAAICAAFAVHIAHRASGRGAAKQ